MVAVNYFSCRGVTSDPLNDNCGNNGGSGDHQSEETEDERWGRFGGLVLLLGFQLLLLSLLLLLFSLLWCTQVHLNRAVKSWTPAWNTLETATTRDVINWMLLRISGMVLKSHNQPTSNCYTFIINAVVMALEKNQTNVQIIRKYFTRTLTARHRKRLRESRRHSYTVEGETIQVFFCSQ